MTLKYSLQQPIIMRKILKILVIHFIELEHEESAHLRKKIDTQYRKGLYPYVEKFALFIGIDATMI